MIVIDLERDLSMFRSKINREREFVYEIKVQNDFIL